MKLLLLATGLLCVSAQNCTSKFACTPGQSFTVNNCQYCGCASDGQGLGFCTLIVCQYPPGDDPRNCRPGASWTEKCRSCCCYRDMGLICTNTC